MGWAAAAIGRRDSESRAAALVGGLLLVLVLVLVLVTFAFARPWLRPYDTTQINDQWKDGVCMQTTPRTCGPCTAATILHHLNDPITEHELAEAARTDGGGTLNWLLIRSPTCSLPRSSVCDPAWADTSSRLSRVMARSSESATLSKAHSP